MKLQGGICSANFIRLEKHSKKTDDTMRIIHRHFKDENKNTLSKKAESSTKRWWKRIEDPFIGYEGNY